jgi:hypothetical protein
LFTTKVPSELGIVGSHNSTKDSWNYENYAQRLVAKNLLSAEGVPDMFPRKIVAPSFRKQRKDGAPLSRPKIFSRWKNRLSSTRLGAVALCDRLPLWFPASFVTRINLGVMPCSSSFRSQAVPVAEQVFARRHELKQP